MGNFASSLLDRIAAGNGQAYLQGAQAAAEQSNTALDPQRAQLLQQQAAAEAARAQSEAALTQGQQLKNQQDQLIIQDQQTQRDAMKAIMQGQPSADSGQPSAPGATSSGLDNVFNSPGGAGQTPAGAAPLSSPAASLYGFDPFVYPRELIRRGALPSTVSAAQNNALVQTQNAYKLDADGRAARQAHLNDIRGPIEGYLAQADDPNVKADQLTDAWADTIRAVRQIDAPFALQLANTVGNPNVAPKSDVVNPVLYSLMSEGGALDRVNKLAGIANTNAEIKLRASQSDEAAANAAAKKRETALQNLSGVQSQDDYNAWREKYPDEKAPPMYSPAFVASATRTAVPVEKQPEFDLKTRQAQALKAMIDGSPQDLDALIDGIVPQNDPMNASTKLMARHAAALGDPAGLQKVIQDAYDQRGRVQVAKENAANKLQIDLGGIGGSSQEPSATAKAVANYQMSLTAAVGRGGPPARAALMNQVLAVNPQFQEQYYNTFQKTENDATTGKIATNANALNTMMGHLDILDHAADALKNGDIQALNRIANFWGAQTGSTAKTTYDAIVHRLGPEVTKAYIASGGTEGERGTNEQDFSSNLAPDQVKQNIGVSALLADSKIKGLQDQYSRGTYGRGGQKLITEEAEAARQRLAGRAGNLQGGGQAYKYTATGANSHKIGSNDGKAWFDLQTGKPVQ